MNPQLPLKTRTATSLDGLDALAQAGANDQILELDRIDLNALIRHRSLPVEQVCARFIHQYERQRLLNAVTSIDRSIVFSRARDLYPTRNANVPLPTVPVNLKSHGVHGNDSVFWPQVGRPRHYPSRAWPGSCWSQVKFHL